jgi:chromosome segregation protein
MSAWSMDCVAPAGEAIDTVHLTKLRLSGFKSFVDPAELVIEPGITGVVGPNGCGKSNLVEALRWVMGESSAKRMRGADMDDVIFGGTADRPSRNIAEVTVDIDNRLRTAPPAFNNDESLTISRRIQRGSGSDFRINGRPVRARDVQTLFQDNGAGAGSPSLVGQGQVAGLINARAADRRLLLEEAAGITGLHGRRHEAELRLKAAENNLARLDDVIGAMESQLAGLKKQARQATRYRNLSDRIRRTEARALRLRWERALAGATAADTALEAAEAEVARRAESAAAAAGEQADAAAALPDLRRAEAEAGAALQRLIRARDDLLAEERRIASARHEAEGRLAQAEADIGRERALAEDAQAARDRLAVERDRLESAGDGEAESIAEAEAGLASATDAVAAAEAEATRIAQRIAAEEARDAALGQRLQAVAARLQAIADRQTQAERERDGLAAEVPPADRIDAAGRDVASAERAAAEAQAAAEAAEADRQAAEAELAAARERAQDADAALARLAAEADGLRSVLDTGGREDFPPLLDRIAVAAGYEAALGAAFGEELAIPLDDRAPAFWRSPAGSTAGDPPLPDGAEPLAPRVEAPDMLDRRLGQIGLVADRATGDALAARLAPGQQLVSRDGGQWRWDGYCVAGEAPNAASARLRHRNRLADLEAGIAAARTARAVAGEAVEASGRAAETARERDRASRRAVQQRQAELTRARNEQARLEREAELVASRLAAAEQTAARAAEDRRAAEVERAELEAERAALPDLRDLRAEADRARAVLTERRGEAGACRNALDRRRREAAARRQRLEQIVGETSGWADRVGRAEGRLAELSERADAARARLADLDAAPGTIAGELAAVRDRIAAAEAAHREATDAAAAGQARQTEADRAARAAEAASSAAREDRVRAEASVEAATTAVAGVRDRIVERLACRPEGLAALAGPDGEDGGEDIAEAEARLDKLVRERESLGAINLRAEEEAAELDRQVAGMIAEREDLTAAIGRLRQAIASLNREARERLLGSFDTVDRHFQSLFGRLFAGGRAYLKLSDEEDPLNAGLEVYACPPGKRLQHLSLLSGGEQALAAIALLFAVFLTKPAPICVLDEVDAALDDANVDRFCTLLEHLAGGGRTRFLVITHHRMTMARVDRLFGVTMPERGVSQLVSVDLEAAVALRDRQRTAAMA